MLKDSLSTYAAIIFTFLLFIVFLHNLNLGLNKIALDFDSESELKVSFSKNLFLLIEKFKTCVDLDSIKETID